MRALLTVAHPDDETFGCGSVLLHLRAAGYDTTVVCATRGEAGVSRIPTDDLAAVREAELRAAARVLGVADVRVLAYGDSELVGEPAPGTLCAASTAEVARDVAAVLEELRPAVVVTLDGTDGHRDHAAIRDATLAAVEAADPAPEATYLWCVARSTMQRWAEHLRATGSADSVYLSLGELGTPDEEITTILDVSPHLATRWAAMEEHATQANPYTGLPEDLQHDFLAVDRLRLVQGADVLADGGR